METTIHLTGKEPLVAKLAAMVGYDGKKFRLVTTETVDVTYNAYWSGGSKSTYTFINLGSMEFKQSPTMHPVFDTRYQGADNVTLIPGIVCVEHSYFCGKDMGLRFFVCPGGLDPRLLPAKVESLTLDEKIVLYATRSCKSSYNGIKDYRFYCATHQNNGITWDRWIAAKASLIERKLLNKAGAITVDGRNAIGDILHWPPE